MSMSEAFAARHAVWAIPIVLAALSILLLVDAHQADRRIHSLEHDLDSRLDRAETLMLDPDGLTQEEYLMGGADQALGERKLEQARTTLAEIEELKETPFRDQPQKGFVWGTLAASTFFLVLRIARIHEHQPRHEPTHPPA